MKDGPPPLQIGSLGISQYVSYLSAKTPAGCGQARVVLEADSSS